MRGVFVDIETTGLDPFYHAPIEVGCMVVDLFSGEILDEYNCRILVTEEEWSRKDPTSMAVNGFTWDDISTGKPKGIVAQEIEAILQKHSTSKDSSFFICQNPSFDRPFFCSLISVYRQEKLGWPYHWLDLASMYWAKYCVQKQTPQLSLKVSKDTIARTLNLPEEPHPHRSQNGVRHLLLCYQHLVGFPGSTT
jgi:DNA polymerase-3 subunit epsilon/oligoribonuclease